MIKSKADYRYYLSRDRIALNINSNSLVDKIISMISPNPVYTFQKRMRKLEYYTNCKNRGLTKLYIAYLKYKFKKTSIKLGFSIPINVITYLLKELTNSNYLFFNPLDLFL